MKRFALALVLLAAGCASKLDAALCNQNLANVQTIAADNATLAKTLDPASQKVYADHATAAVKLAQTMADGAAK